MNIRDAGWHPDWKDAEWHPDWKPWFAWYPVRLLTWEIAWLRTVMRRHPSKSGHPWSYFGSDYANP